MLYRHPDYHYIRGMAYSATFWAGMFGFYWLWLWLYYKNVDNFRNVAPGVFKKHVRIITEYLTH